MPNKPQLAQKTKPSEINKAQRTSLLRSLKLSREFHPKEARYEFRVLVRNPNTAKGNRYTLPSLVAPWVFLRLCGLNRYAGLQSWPSNRAELKVLRSPLFKELSKKGLIVAQWLCTRAILQAWVRGDPPPVIATLPAHELRRLLGMRRKVKKMIGELESMDETVKQMEKYPLLHDFDVRKHLARAVSPLLKFEQLAAREPSRTRILKFHLTRHRPFWMFRPPAIAYALLRLLMEHASPRLKAKEAYLRIGNFERDCLGRRSRKAEADVEDTIRRQIYVIKGRPTLRKQMDRILQRLLAAEWFGLDHTLNCDWESPKTLLRPSR